MPVCVGFHTSSVKLMKLLTADTHRKIAEEEKQSFVFQKMRKTKNITAGSATVQQCNTALCWLLRGTTTVRSEHRGEEVRG